MCNYVNLDRMQPPFQVEKYKKDYALIVQTAEQVKKDLGTLSIDILLSGNPATAYTELFDQVRPVIERISEKHPEQFGNLLYRIDIPEKDYRRVCAIQPAEAMYDALTDFILYRELFKVICRRHYSNPGE